MKEWRIEGRAWWKLKIALNGTRDRVTDGDARRVERSLGKFREYSALKDVFVLVRCWCLEVIARKIGWEWVQGKVGESGWEWVRVGGSEWEWVRVGESGWKWVRVDESGWNWVRVGTNEWWTSVRIVRWCWRKIGMPMKEIVWKKVLKSNKEMEKIVKRVVFVSKLWKGLGIWVLGLKVVFVDVLEYHNEIWERERVRDEIFKWWTLLEENGNVWKADGWYLIHNPLWNCFISLGESNIVCNRLWSKIIDMLNCMFV